MINDVTWSEFKTRLSSTGLNWIYTDELNGNYAAYLSVNGFTLRAYLTNGTADHTDFEDNYKSLAFKQSSDSDGRPLVQNTVAPAGWGYVDFNFNFNLNDTTLNCRSLTFDGSRDLNGTSNIGTLTQTYQKSDYTKIASPVASDFTNNIVWRRIDLELPFDFVVVGGRFGLTGTIASHATLWCIGAPDIDKSLGGSHHFMVEKSLSHVTPDQSFIADGRTAKLMTYDATYHFNKISIFINHALSESAFIEANYQIYVAPGSI